MRGVAPRRGLAHYAMIVPSCVDECVGSKHLEMLAALAMATVPYGCMGPRRAQAAVSLIPRPWLLTLLSGPKKRAKTTHSTDKKGAVA